MENDPDMRPPWEKGTLAVLEASINRLNLNATITEVGPVNMFEVREEGHEFVYCDIGVSRSYLVH